MIECPVCHAVSHHPVDEATGWCSRCERFTGKNAEEVRAAAELQNPVVTDAILRRLAQHGAAEPDVLSRARLMRWFRWNVRCHRGRRCANLVVEDFGANDEYGEVVPVAGMTAVLHYVCDGCGTSYREEVLLDSGAHAPIPLGRERVR